MFEQYFNFLRTPFARDIPEKELYCNPGVVMLSYELSKLLCRKKFNAVSMSEALKAGME